MAAFADGHNPSTFWHQGSCLPDRHEKCFGLRIHGGVPFVQSDLHGRLVKRGSLRSRVAYKNIKRAELGADLLEDTADFLRPANIGLDQEPV
jgi:hypothetical protein